MNEAFRRVIGVFIGTLFSVGYSENVVTKTGNNHKPRANDHKPPASNHKRPSKPFPNSNYLIFLETRRTLTDVNKHRRLTSLCNLIITYLAQLMTY